MKPLLKFGELSMRIMKRLSFNLVVTCLFLCCAASAFAAPTVTINSSGKGMFTLQETGFDGIAGAKITITYDTKTLVNPRVTQGGLATGALFVANTTSPGSIIVAFATADPKGIVGDGLLATISFDLVGKSSGVIQLLSADLVNTKGAKIDAPDQGSMPPQTTDGTTSPVQGSGSGATEGATSPAQGSGSGVAANPAQTSPAATTGTSPGWVGGQLTMPGDGEPAQGKNREEAAPATAAAQKEPLAAPGAGTNAPERSLQEASTGAAGGNPEYKTVRYKSVLEQFRTFEGVKTPAALIAIFKQSDMQAIRQEPPIVLSDGSTRVKVYINHPGSGKEAPRFDLLGAQLISLKIVDENILMLEVLPVKGACQATITMLQNGAITEIPLTVASPIPREVKIGKGGDLTEADFNMFLKEQGTKKAPRFDLNGDGVRDYIDDFIFTANYLATRSSETKTRTPVNK
jgi:hypothetical protein